MSEPIWESEIVKILVYVGSRVLLTAIILSAVGGLALLALRIWIDQQ